VDPGHALQLSTRRPDLVAGNVASCRVAMASSERPDK
jgi:hypothetical protein